MPRFQLSPIKSKCSYLFFSTIKCWVSHDYSICFFFTLTLKCNCGRRHHFLVHFPFFFHLLVNLEGDPYLIVFKELDSPKLMTLGSVAKVPYDITLADNC